MSLDLIWAFLRPECRAQIQEQEHQARVRACEDAQPWDEDKTKFAKVLPLQGATYDNPRYRLFDSKPMTSLKRRGVKDLKNLVWSPCGQYAYANRQLPQYGKLPLAQGHKRGCCFFDQAIVTPVLYEYKEGHSNELPVWMGITPMEILTQRQGVRKAKGHCLIGGLGLGWFLWKVAEKKSVKKITLVEISQPLLDWYGNDLVARVTEATGTEIEVICDDVLPHIGKHGDDVRHLVDIWPDYPTYDHYLPKAWREAIAHVDHFWGWGVLSDPDNYRGW